jgi:ADP-L-glycero-D-manno-heptose 6-epimerase
MIVVTGGEGFIGQNLIKELENRNYIGVISLDTKTWSLDKIYNWLMKYADQIDCIFHLGAITDTTEMDRNKFDEYNVGASMFIWNFCTNYQIPLIYASSAATYGDGNDGFNDEITISELKPLNPYGWSKQQFDMFVMDQSMLPPFWAGLKFFNVYGYGEEHKGNMASVVLQMYNRLLKFADVKLFKSHRPDYKDGEQLRDFIYVDDVVDVCIWMYEHKPVSGIYNVGTGKARTFNDLAKAVFKSKYSLGPSIIMLNDWTQNIQYIDIPSKIRDNYQYITEAKISKLRKAGYSSNFHELEDGVDKYIKKLLKNN